MKKYIVLLIFILACISMAAQNEVLSSSNQGSIYLYSGNLTGTEQLKIKAYIWGQVRNPGLYIIPDNTDLLTLISSAGGPTENAKLAKIKIVRQTEIGEQIIMVDLKEYTKTADKKLIPMIQPGDTIVVPGTTFYAMTKIADWLSKLAIFLSIYVIIKDI